PLGRAPVVDYHLGDRRTRPVRLEFDGLCIRQQRDVWMLERGPNAEDFGVGFGLDHTGESVTGRAADASAVGHVALVEHDAARRVERVVAGGGELVRELLNAWFVGNRREGVRRARRWFGRVLTPGAVHLVELFGLRVVGLHLVVGNRPGR